MEDFEIECDNCGSHNVVEVLASPKLPPKKPVYKISEVIDGYAPKRDNFVHAVMHHTQHKLECKNCGFASSQYTKDTLGNIINSTAKLNTFHLDSKGIISAPVKLNQKKIPSEKQDIHLLLTDGAVNRFNMFISKHLPGSYAHLIDSDDNDGEYVRNAINKEMKYEFINGQKVVWERIYKREGLYVNEDGCVQMHFDYIEEQIERLKKELGSLEVKYEGR